MTDAAGSSAEKPTSAAPTESPKDLIEALAGKQGARERAVGERTRRVVTTSLGVLRDQQADRRRSRALALASFLIVLLALGPFVWRVADDIIGGEHWSDIATQTSLWVCVLCPAVLAAAIIAGWSKVRH